MLNTSFIASVAECDIDGRHDPAAGHHPLLALRLTPALDKQIRDGGQGRNGTTDARVFQSAALATGEPIEIFVDATCW